MLAPQDFYSEALALIAGVELERAEERSAFLAQHRQRLIIHQAGDDKAIVKIHLHVNAIGSGQRLAWYLS